jgi:uncharacterized membrane protein
MRVLNRLVLCTSLLLLIKVLVAGLLVGTSSSSPLISSLNYYTVYDLLSNCGLMEISALVNFEEITHFEIPLNLFEESAQFELVNYTSSKDLFVAGLNVSRERISVIALGSGELRVFLSACGLLEESGVAVYFLMVNTEHLANYAFSVNVTFDFIGNYNVTGEAIKAKLEVSKSNNITRVAVTGFGLALLAVIPVIEETPEQTPPGRGQQALWVLVGVIVGSLLAGSGVLVYLLAKRGVKFSVERPDYLTDSSYRAIIRVLGDSGNKGLLQSEIASRTGLSKSTISRKLRRMEEDGLVVIKRSGKYNYVYLTDKGLDLYKRVVKRGAS